MLATRQDRSRIQRELLRLRTYSFGSKFETQRLRVAITLGFIAFTTLIGLVLDDIGKVETTSPPPAPHTPHHDPVLVLRRGLMCERSP